MDRRNIDSEEHLTDDDDTRDEAVIAADDTGMISSERLTVETEIAEELEGGDGSGA